MKALALLILILALPTAVNAEKISDFTLKSNQGKNIRISDLRGKVVMMNFWASWCGPCITEMPQLERIYQRYSAAGFELLGVNNDDSEQKATDWLEGRGISFPIVYDLDDEVRNRFKKYQGIPLSIFVDCDGNIAEVHRSYKPGDEKKYLKIIKGLIRSCSA
jgi:thiol-disulfide isomerase/thioredoxin